MRENTTRTFTVTNNALTNVLVSYAGHKLAAEEYYNDALEFGKEDELYDDADYAHHTAYCAAAQEWMRMLGISPDCNFVSEIINHEKLSRI